MTRIMAVDPGDSTGLAWAGLDHWSEDAYVTTVAPDHEKVYEAIKAIQPEILIVEWFITGQRLNQYSRRTIELCGACEALAWVVGAKLIRHTPKTRYPCLELAEEMLTTRHGPRGTTRKGAGTWTDHQADGLSHLLAYLYEHDVNSFHHLIKGFTWETSKPLSKSLSGTASNSAAIPNRSAARIGSTSPRG